MLIHGEKMLKKDISRRGLLKTGVAIGIVHGFPTIIPSRVLGQQAPSNKLQIGVIGCGRIAGGMDIPGIWHNQDLATIVALSDCDLKRMRATQTQTSKLFQKNAPKPKLFQDYHELLSDTSVDAVMICTPEFCHAQQCVEAALAGKDIYVQKPLALTISESRCIANVIKKTGRVFHLGTQQRSEGPSTFGPQFRKAAEYVLNGRLGKIQRVEIGLPQDPSEPTNLPLSQLIPDTFNYDMWQGSTPEAPFSELRTHPQGKGTGVNFERPGWMTIQQYCMGMISNWGAHHIDIAQWGLGFENSGPIHIEGQAVFPQRRLWDAHGQLDVKLTYANGVVMNVADVNIYPNGVRFIGENGWIFCGRTSAKATSKEKSAGGKYGYWRPLETSSQNLIEGTVTHPVVTNPKNHHRIWLENIKTRQPTNTPLEAAHRTTTTCILAFTAMNLKRPLQWNPATENFEGDEEANATLSRPERAPYGVRNALKKAGWHS